MMQVTNAMRLYGLLLRPLCLYSAKNGRTLFLIVDTSPKFKQLGRNNMIVEVTYPGKSILFLTCFVVRHAIHPALFQTVLHNIFVTVTQCDLIY